MKCVYLINIQDTDIYKIGFTKQSPEKRIKDLQTGNPYKMVLVDSYKSQIAPSIESVIHNYFKHKKNRGLKSDLTLIFNSITKSFPENGKKDILEVN